MGDAAGGADRLNVEVLLEFLEPVGRRVRLLPGQEVVDIRRGSPGCDLGLRSRWGASQRIRADVVVLGTGFGYELPEALRRTVEIALQPQGPQALMRVP